jgi:DNA-directed RNA polymerase specialized sigma24 family protein
VDRAAVPGRGRRAGTACERPRKAPTHKRDRASGHNRWVQADQLTDLLPWCATLSSEAAELAAEVVVAAGRRWPSLADAPEDLRALTVQTYLGWSRRSDARAAANQGDHLADELRPIAAALDKLPALQRAVIMLSLFERLTRTEIAGIVDRPISTVSRELDRALLTLGDPYTVAATLSALSWDLPEIPTVDRAVRRVARLHARRRTRVRLLAAAVGLVLLTSVVVVMGNRPTPVARQEAAWAFTSALDPPPGWKVHRRMIGRDWETTIVRSSTGGPGRCLIAVGRVGLAAFSKLPQDVESVRISGRSGFFSERGWPGAPGPALAWEYAPDAWATVECTGVADAAHFLSDLARQVRFTTEPVMLPYRMREAPRPYRVSWIVVGRVSNSAIVYLTRDDYPEGTLVISVNYPASRPLYGVRFDSGGLSRYKNSEHVGVCKEFGDSHLCVRSEVPPVRAGLSSTWHRRSFSQLDSVFTNLVLADSATNRSTWFDARTALPTG